MTTLTILPKCRHRGPEVRNGRHACHSDKLIQASIGAGPNDTKWIDAAAYCPICPYRDVPKTVPQPITHTPEPAPRQRPCLYEGPVIDWCQTCNPAAADLRHIRDCSIHDRCARHHLHLTSDVKICSRCDDYTVIDPSTFTRRHLLYHIYPVRNSTWRRNLDALIQRLPLFTGRRVMAIATDPPIPIPYRHGTGPPPDNARIPLTSEPPEAVESYMAGHDIEFIRCVNDPNLREVATFLPLFSRVSDLVSPSDVTLYAHAKGSTRAPGHPAHEWTDVLTEAMLDYWPVVARVLGRTPLAGCFLKRGAGWRAEQSRSDWHYSGSWFWFRNVDLFSLPDWPKIDQFWSGIEPYPSQHFHHSDAGVVFHEGQVPQVNLYNGRYWEGTVRPEWNKWKEAHRA